MSDFNTSDLLHIKDTVQQRDGYNKASGRECTIGRIYMLERGGELMVTKVFDKYGYSDNMSMKHCELSSVESVFVFKCSGCGKYKSKCKHGIICKCNPDCIHDECIQCILFEGVESMVIIDKLIYGESSYYDKMMYNILMDAVRSSKTCRYGVKPTYDCLYDEASDLHRDIYKKMMDDICFNTFCLVIHKRCGINSPMNGLYYDVRQMIRMYVYE